MHVQQKTEMLQCTSSSSWRGEKLDHQLPWCQVDQLVWVVMATHTAVCFCYCILPCLGHIHFWNLHDHLRPKGVFQAVSSPLLHAKTSLKHCVSCETVSILLESAIIYIIFICWSTVLTLHLKPTLPYSNHVLSTVPILVHHWSGLWLQQCHPGFCWHWGWVV